VVLNCGGESEVNANLVLDKAQYDSVVAAAVARLRSVVLAAATTVLVVTPLLQNVFWFGMALTIMVGLTGGTFLTMFVLPTLYCIFLRVSSPDIQEGKKNRA